ncbi:MAG: hypothetical protein U1A27_08295 [Phycisphaerae bacterium]
MPTSGSSGNAGCRARPGSGCCSAARAAAVGRNDTLIISRIEAHNGPKFEIHARQQPFIAAAAGWFYLAKFVVPVPVAPMYPKWNVRPDARSGGCRCSRGRSPPRPPGDSAARIDHLAADVVQFLVSILPAARPDAFQLPAASYVAGHYLYLPAIGGGIAIAAVAVRRIIARHAAAAW